MSDPVTIGLIISASINLLSFIAHAYVCTRSSCVVNNCCMRGEFSVEPSPTSNEYISPRYNPVAKVERKGDKKDKKKHKAKEDV